MSSPSWRYRPFDGTRIAEFARAVGVAPLTAQLLINRDVATSEVAEAFLDPRMGRLHDPETLPGATEAAERIVRAIAEDRKIVIYGDYDVDGVCGTTILWEFLRLAGAKQLEYYIPHRVEEGYGVNPDAVAKIAGELGASLLITVDCGISALAEAKLARELGLELIITDHHTIGDELPAADVVVHPRLPGSGYPCGDLCGAAVAFKLAWQVAKSFGDGKKASPHMRNFLVEALGLVALATIADIVPIQGENRVLVRQGLINLASKPSVGLRALLDVSMKKPDAKISTGVVGFGIAPRINAAGRLEQASVAVELLTSRDPEDARRLAQQLDSWNQKRRDVERATVDEARKLAEERGNPHAGGAVVVGAPQWHPGVIGIVASRLVESFHRPTIVFAVGDKLAQGSGRSVPGFNLYEAIKECSSDLVAFGGHAAAAGVRLLPERLEDFAARFDAVCRARLTAEQKQRVLLVDAETRLDVLKMKVIEELARLEPHGMGNPRPLLSATDVLLVAAPKVFGDGTHLRMRFQQGATTLNAVAWNAPEKYRRLKADSTCAIAFHASINEWNGYREVQLEIKDIQLQEARDDAGREPESAAAPAL